MWNKQHSVYIKLGLNLQSLTTLKIGELLLTANSLNLSNLTVWRVSVNSCSPNLSDIQSGVLPLAAYSPKFGFQYNLDS